MTNDEKNALRALLREEINAAVYASEQRINENMKVTIATTIAPIEGRLDSLDTRMDRLDTRMDGLDGRVSRLEGMVEPMTQHLILLRAAQREMQGDLVQVKNDLTQVILILNEATIQINELQTSQRALEVRVEENTHSLRRDIQQLAQRLTDHENTPIDRAHPPAAL